MAEVAVENPTDAPHATGCEECAARAAKKATRKPRTPKPPEICNSCNREIPREKKPRKKFEGPASEKQLATRQRFASAHPRAKELRAADPTLTYRQAIQKALAAPAALALRER